MRMPPPVPQPVGQTEAEGALALALKACERSISRSLMIIDIMINELLMIIDIMINELRASSPEENSSYSVFSPALQLDRDIDRELELTEVGLQQVDEIFSQHRFVHVSLRAIAEVSVTNN